MLEIQKVLSYAEIPLGRKDFRLEKPLGGFL